MPLPPSLKTGLKEWATVCYALGSGRQIILLRKGGILESIGGFELETPQFLLFPTYLHQNAEMLKPDARFNLQAASSEPDQVSIDFAAEVTSIEKLKSRPQMDRLMEEHIWTSPLIDMRFNYRPMNPLYLMMVRAYRLPQGVTLQNTPEYAGCKSWVPLDSAISTAGATPVLSNESYEARCASIRQRLAEIS